MFEWEVSVFGLSQTKRVRESQRYFAQWIRSFLFVSTLDFRVWFADIPMGQDRWGQVEELKTKGCRTAAVNEDNCPKG